MSGAPRAAEAAARWVGVALISALGLVLLSAFPYFEQVRNANEIPRLVQSMALVDGDGWAIDGPSRRGLALGPDIAKSPKDGRIYPNKPPGASVVGSVAFRIARARAPGHQGPSLRVFTWWARLLAGVLPVLVVAGLAWRELAPRYGVPAAVATVSLWVLATPIFSYARLFYGHALAACLLYAGVLALERAGEGRRLEWAAVGGLLAALAITVEYGAAFAGLPIAVALMWPVFRPGADDRRAAGKRAAVALAGALVPVVLLALYQRTVFGSPFATGYHHAADPGFAELHGQGLLGLGLPRWDNVVTHVLSPKTGLLFWSPLCAVAVYGLVAGAIEGRRSCRLHLAIFAVILVMGLSLSFQGGWRIGPRYLVVAMPMLLVGLAESLSRAADSEHRSAWLTIVATLAGWSLAANALAATLWPHLDPTNVTEPFGAVLLPLWREGFASYGLPRLSTSLALSIPVGLGAGALAWCARGNRRSWIAVASVVVSSLGGALAIAALPRLTTPHPKTDANLRYIQRMYAPEQEADPPSRALPPPRSSSKGP